MDEADDGSAYQQWLDSFLGEVFGASQRAGAIVAAAQVENTLEDAIFSRLKAMEAPEVSALTKGAAAPLGTFHAKIQVGYALNLYSLAFRDDLTLVKDIRNRFAHEQAARDFSDPEITKLCERLNYPSHRAATTAEPEDKEARLRFLTTTQMQFLALGLVAIAEDRPTPPQKPAVILNYGHRPGARAPSRRKARARPSKGKPH